MTAKPKYKYRIFYYEFVHVGARWAAYEIEFKLAGWRNIFKPWIVGPGQFFSEKAAIEACKKHAGPDVAANIEIIVLNQS